MTNEKRQNFLDENDKLVESLIEKFLKKELLKKEEMKIISNYFKELERQEKEDEKYLKELRNFKKGSPI